VTDSTTRQDEPARVTPDLLAERIAHERELRQIEKQAIEHEREMRVIFDAHERELRTLAETAVERARQIQFDEYERRLTTLNHAHEQAVEAQRATVPRETFDTYVRETRLANELALRNVELSSEKRQVDVDRRLTVLERAGARLGGAGELGRFSLERLTGFAALGVALYVALTR
jgi:hypothetical protein